MRLVESAQEASPTFAFYLELIDRGDRIAVDGGTADDLEDAVVIAENLISRAEELSQQ